MQRTFTRRRRLIGAGAASAGTIAIAATAAFGHIPGVGNGLAPTTNGPDLRSVTVLPYDLIDGLAEQARFCFDGGLERLSAAPAANFAIQTYDARRAMNPAALSKATDDPNCLIASFPSGVDIAQGNVGQVTPGAVSDVSNRTNDYASEPVTGSVSTPRAGATTGPDLVSVTVDVTNAANKVIVYTFDESVNPTPSAPYSAGSFGYYNAEGNAVAGSAVTVSGSKAIVGFGAAAGPESASRYFVNPGAVEDRPQTAVVAPATTLTTPSSPGYLSTAASPRPTIAGVVSMGPQAFKVTFTQAVSFVPGDAVGFIAVSDDGTAPAAASSLGTGGDPTSIVATFPASVSADPASIVRVLVGPGTVTAVSDGVTTNPGDQASTSTPLDAPGFTNGPDLLAIGVDKTLNRVVYKYDENVNRDVPPDPGSLRAIAADGSVIASTGGVVVADNFVVANYPSTIATAVSFSNPFNGVTDRTGRPNPHQSVSNQIEQGAPAPVVPPPAVVPPPPAVKPVQRFKTFVTIKRRGLRYSGKARSPRTACRRGRRVVLKKRGSSRRFGTAITSSKGNYTIKRRTRARGRVYVVVVARGKSVKCSSGKSRTIRG